jgi:hypothetical protein
VSPTIKSKDELNTVVSRAPSIRTFHVFFSFSWALSTRPRRVSVPLTPTRVPLVIFFGWDICNMARSQPIELKLGQALRVCSHLDSLGSCGARATGSKDCGPNEWVGKIGTFRPPQGPNRPPD